MNKVLKKELKILAAEKLTEEDIQALNVGIEDANKGNLIPWEIAIKELKLLLNDKKF